ncbi:MAG TPA: molybdopterin molybdotransferase MoeA [Methanosarcinaceae archaeon]|nr:molybdopterin molybdotransferase MoeA [Methanosarcinaceae archaeon]
MGTIIKELTKVEDAKILLLDSISSLSATELIPLIDCIDRVLASPITAKRDVPHYRRAAMDGYAVQSADIIGASVTNPVMLGLSDDAEQSTCTRVHTGSNVPDSADAVVMIEDTTPIGDMVEIRTQVHPNKHIGCIGEDMTKGELILEAGHLLRPCDVAVIASLGLSEVEVYRKPVVAVIPTGDEVVPRTTSEIPPPGKVLETNGLMVGLYVEKWGGKARYCDIVPDKPKLIEDAIQSNLDADMIILCGGTSVGERDHVPAVVDSLGDILVHGVGLSPGKPTALGIIDNIPVVCMPGYPVAGLVGLFAFARPALRKVGNIPDISDTIIKARMSGKINSKEGYMTYARVILEGNIAHPLMTSGSGVLSSVAKANGFVIIPENVEGYEEGQDVDVVLIE